MDWKKIRRAICGAAAAVAVCFTAAGINTKPVYAADMGAVYGIFEHGVGWSAYHGDQTAERAGNNDMQPCQRIGEPLLFVGCELHAGGPQPLDDT